MQNETVPSGENTKGELGGYEKTDVRILSKTEISLPRLRPWGKRQHKCRSSHKRFRR